MNRRIFLKIIGCLPFIKVESKTSELTEGKLCEILDKWEDKPPYNGQIYESPSHLRAIVQWTGIHKADEYVLLSVPGRSSYGGTNMMICKFKRKDGGYDPFYTKVQLKKYLKDWTLLENHKIEYHWW